MKTFVPYSTYQWWGKTLGKFGKKNVILKYILPSQIPDLLN